MVRREAGGPLGARLLTWHGGARYTLPPRGLRQCAHGLDAAAGEDESRAQGGV